MANFFDQFDEPGSAAGNFFDQFDAVSAATPETGYEMSETDRAHHASLQALNDPVQQAQYAKQQKASAAPPRTWVDAIMQPAAHMSRGAVKGLTNIAGLPVDLVNAGAGLTGLETSERPFLGSQSIRDAIGAGYEVVADAAGVPETNYWAPAKHPIDKVAENIGQFGGEASIPVVGGALTALKPAAALSSMRGNTLGSAFNEFFVEPARASLPKFAAKEASAAAAAGAGASVAQQALGDPSNPAWVKGALDLGGAGTGLGIVGAGKFATSTAANAAKALFNRGAYSDSVVNGAVTGDLLGAMGARPNEYGVVDSADLVNKIMATDNPARQASRVVEGFVPSTNEFIPSPELQSLTRTREAVDPTRVFATRKGANNTAIDGAIGELEPEGSVGVLREVLAQERARKLDAAAAQTQAADTALSSAEQFLHPSMTAEGRGANVRSSLDDARSAVAQQESAMWQPINESRTTVKTAPVVRQLADVDNSLSKIELADGARPKQIGLLEQIMSEAEGGGIQLREIIKAKSRVGNAANAASNAGMNDQARIARNYGSALERAADEAMPRKLKAQHDAAKAATRDRADRFDRDNTAIGQVLKKQDGRYSVPDNDVARRFVQSDEQNISDFKSLIKETGKDARTRDAVKDQVLADIRSRNLLEKPDQLSQHIERYKSVLDEFPELRNELTNAGNLRTSLEEARRAEVAQLKKFGSDEVAGTSPVGKYLRYGDEKAEQALKTVLNSAEPAKSMDGILSFAKEDPRAVNGARKAFWGLMQKEAKLKGNTADDAWNPKALASFLEDPTRRAVAERLYKDNPQHLENLDAISNAIRHYDPRAGRTSVPAELKRGESVLPPFNTLAAYSFAYQRGVVGIPWLGTTIAAKVVRAVTRGAQDGAYLRILDNALVDPQFAADLLRKNNPANRAILARKAKGWRAGLLDEMLRDDDEESEASLKNPLWRSPMPDRLRPYLVGGAARRSDSLSGLDRSFVDSLAKMYEAAPEDIRQGLLISSAYRSPQVQAEIYNAAVQKYGSEQEARRWAAPPGRSNHNRGLAVDFRYGNPAAQHWAHANAGNYGLGFPLSNENWHLEPAGIRGGAPAPTAPAVPQEGTYMAQQTLPEGATIPTQAFASANQQPSLEDVSGMVELSNVLKLRQQRRAMEVEAQQKRRQALFSGPSPFG